VLQTVIGSYDPNTQKFSVLENETLAKIFGQILELTGIPGLAPASLGIGLGREEGEQPAPVQQQEPELLV
jgi:hypothetical protein